MKLSFGIIWGFMITQMAALTISFMILLYLNLPPNNLVLSLSFISGLLVFRGVSRYFEKLNFVVGLLSFVVFFFCLFLIPNLASHLLDKELLRVPENTSK
jgi:hypothetical protein